MWSGGLPKFFGCNGRHFEMFSNFQKIPQPFRINIDMFPDFINFANLLSTPIF